MAKPIPPTRRNDLSRAGLVYLGLVIGLGALVVCLSARTFSQAVPGAWIFLLALTLFSSTIPIKIPTVKTTVSVSETFVFICALLYGPEPATLIAAADGMLIYVRHVAAERVSARRVPSVAGVAEPPPAVEWKWKKFFFNGAQPAVSMFVASHAFFGMAGIEPLHAVRLQQYPLALLTFASLYFLMNSGLNAIIVGIQRLGEDVRPPSSGRWGATRRALTTVWEVWTRNNFGWVLANYMTGASVAALLVHNTDPEKGFDFVTLGLVAPLLVVTYLVFKTSMQKVDEANKYLEGIMQSWSLAVGSRGNDPVTHDHIKRVEANVDGLARRVGIKDAGELKAIKAAALLHDIGKLAIPEHILNKPGKLSPTEFEKMKEHAAIGAQILEEIGFPYKDTAPIVRHHHERWDGKGYPDGLAGEHIPKGARVLAVVDCFDALTSDRPYRRALSDVEALAMLKADRGKAYDPAIVDEFVSRYRSPVSREADLAPQRRPTPDSPLVTLDEGSRGGAVAADALAVVQDGEPVPVTLAPAAAAAFDAAAAQTEARVLPILASLHSFSAQALLGEAADELGAQLCTLTPATLCAVYTHDVKTGELVLTHASGTASQSLRGLRMAIGERLSGWVAANRKTICNSDAALDLAVVEPQPSVVFQSCLSTPLVAGDSLVGVLTLYAEGSVAFSPDDRRLVERTAGPLAHLVKGALELETVQRATETGALACWPLVDLQAERPRHEDPCTCPVAAVALRIWGVDAGEIVSTPRLLLTRAAAVLRRDLRVADLLYQDGPTGLVALLPHGDGDAARAIARRARTSLLTALSGLGSQAAAHVTVSTGVAWTPDDGLLLDDVMDAARLRAGADDAQAGSRDIRTDVA